MERPTEEVTEPPSPSLLVAHRLAGQMLRGSAGTAVYRSMLLAYVPLRLVVLACRECPVVVSGGSDGQATEAELKPDAVCRRTDH
jgi:hypothetical protein